MHNLSLLVDSLWREAKSNLRAYMYLIARLTIRFGQLTPFSEALSLVVDDLEAAGWELVVSLRAVVGDLTEVTNIWKVPDASAACDVLLMSASDPTVVAHVEAMATYVSGEVLQLAADTPLTARHAAVPQLSAP
jgi:hypothetical protein